MDIASIEDKRSNGSSRIKFSPVATDISVSIYIHTHILIYIENQKFDTVAL